MARIPRYQVQVRGSASKSVEVEAGATRGATIGVNLFNADGSLVTALALAAAGTGAVGDVNEIASTIWSRVFEKPANIVQAAALSGAGLVTRQSSGDWIVRTLASADADHIVITDGDGDAGAPTIDAGPQVAMLDDDELVTGSWTFPDLTVEGDAPVMWLNDTGATADEGKWRWRADLDQLTLQAINDAEDSAILVFNVTRDGVTPDVMTWSANEINFSADSHDFSGAARFTDVGGIRVENVTPSLTFDENDVGGDSGIYILAQSTGTLFWRAAPDTEIGGTTFFQVERTGTNVDELTLTADELVLDGEISNQVVFTATPGTPDSLLGTITLSNVAPLIYLIETDAGTDEGFWRMGAYGNAWRVEARDDSGNAGGRPITITRTGTVITDMDLEATGITLDLTTLTIFPDSATGVITVQEGNLGIAQTRASGTCVLDINAISSDGTSSAITRIGRSQSSSGSNWLYLMRGNSSTAAPVRLAAKGSTAAGGHLYLQESADAFDDIASYGQFWVRDDTPCVPMFTDDAGNDQQLIGVETGSFTITLTGMSSSTTGTANYCKVGDLVAIWVASSITGTSNSTGFGATGLPSQLTPTTVNVTTLCARVRNNSTANHCAYCAILTSGGLSFNLLTTGGAGAPLTHGLAFNNSGTKGLDSSWMIVYAVN